MRRPCARGQGAADTAVLDSWSAERWSDSDDDLRDGILGALERILPGTMDHIEFAELCRWREEYFTIGAYRDLGRFRQLCDQDQRIELAGDFHSFQNLESATISGLRAAERLLAGDILQPGRRLSRLGRRHRCLRSECVQNTGALALNRLRQTTTLMTMTASGMARCMLTPPRNCGQAWSSKSGINGFPNIR